ncbi:MAG: hypothetical protein ACKVVT_02130 [Dehalococcoidia bacterium]
MRDGVFVARQGIPAVAILTEEFVTQGEFVAKAVGMPAIPRVVIEHPVSGSGKANITRVAEEVTPRLLRALVEGRA